MGYRTRPRRTRRAHAVHGGRRDHTRGPREGRVHGVDHAGAGRGAGCGIALRSWIRQIGRRRPAPFRPQNVRFGWLSSTSCSPRCCGSTGLSRRGSTWCCHVTAAGGCAIERKGKLYHTAAPTIVPFADAGCTSSSCPATNPVPTRSSALRPNRSPPSWSNSAGVPPQRQPHRPHRAAPIPHRERSPRRSRLVPRRPRLHLPHTHRSRPCG